MSGFSLYIHIPYCYHKCPYCDFNTYAVATIPEKEYVAALLSELDYRAAEPEWRGREVNTIFFGGGTPSLFTHVSIRKIIAAISRTFPIKDDAEISLEANPGTVTPESLEGYKEAGVNRISFGAQSFRIDVLKKLGRMHTPDQVIMSVENARSAGLNNLSLDLMFGIEGQTVSDLRSDLEMVRDLNPEHISIYGLTIEKGTPFYTNFKKGLMKLPTEEVLVEMFNSINKILPSFGFKHYEVSNYSRPNREAQHNLAYWKGIDYLGIGAGAHSFVVKDKAPETRSAVRWSNFALPAKYIKTSVAQGKSDSWQDTLDKRALMFEFFFLGMRMIDGVSLIDFKERFAESAHDMYSVTIDMLLEQELIELDKDCMKLSNRGLILADSVFEHFIEPQQTGKKLAANS